MSENKAPSAMKVIVGMPAFNEQRSIGSLVLRTKQYAETVLVVDDGSADLTARTAELGGARVVRHGENRGYGSAIRTLLEEAKNLDADVLVIIDADAQHNPDEIPSLIEAVKEGADVVIGSRVESQKSVPAYRRAGQAVLRQMTNIAARENLSDTESGFRAYSRRALHTLELKETGMAISAEIVTEAAAKGLKLAEVPISVSYEGDTSTLNPVKHGVSNMNRIMVMISERRPMLFFGTGGIILLLIGLVEAINVIRLYYFGGDSIFAVGPALLAILFFTTGILTLFTGVILNVISKRIGELKR